MLAYEAAEVIENWVASVEFKESSGEAAKLREAWEAVKVELQRGETHDG